MGSIEPRPSGRYWARPYSSSTGKRLASKTFDTYEEARGYVQAMEGRATAGHAAGYIAGGGDPREIAKAITVRAAADEWLSSYDVEPSTLSTMTHAATRMCDDWGSTPVSEVTRTAVDKWLVTLAHRPTQRCPAGLGTDSRKQRLLALRQTMQWACRAGVIAADPTAGAVVRARKAHREVTITDAEFERVMGHVPAWLAPAFLLGLDAGLRRGEIAGLRDFRVDLTPDEHGYGRVVVADVLMTTGGYRDTPKGGTAATVPLSPRLVAALDLHRRVYGWQPGGRVFVNPNTHRPVTLDALGRYWDKACKAAGVTGVHLHDLRRTCATRLGEADAPASVIQSILRHADVRTSAFYVKGREHEAQVRWLVAAASAL